MIEGGWNNKPKQINTICKVQPFLVLWCARLPRLPLCVITACLIIRSDHIGAAYCPRRCWLLRDTLVEEPLDLGVDASVFSLALGSLAEAGAGNGSWITLRSSLLCWPKCSLAKSKPLTLGVCSWSEREGGREGVREGGITVLGWK